MSERISFLGSRLLYFLCGRQTGFTCVLYLSLACLLDAFCFDRTRKPKQKQTKKQTTKKRECIARCNSLLKVLYGDSSLRDNSSCCWFFQRERYSSRTTTAQKSDVYCTGNTISSIPVMERSQRNNVHSPQLPSLGGCIIVLQCMGTERMTRRSRNRQTPDQYLHLAGVTLCLDIWMGFSVLERSWGGLR
jgi:hypothetical protein